MIIRWMKISLALVLSLIFTISLTKLVISVWENFNFGTSERYDVEVWLEQNQLHQYKETFRRRGEYRRRIASECILYEFFNFFFSAYEFTLTHTPH